jgi:glycosyltransferase involved in cell wall biosynthesis
MGPCVRSEAMISVVTPFFNEERILQQAVGAMLSSLRTLPEAWELIIVNDGSIDGSLEVVQPLLDEYPELRLVSYQPNRGRGYALRMGIRAARGELIFTTEIDLSWGTEVVQRMYETLRDNCHADIVIASPHRSGGGYRNIPLYRVMLSRYGNYIIRAGLSFQVTMYTGMTRGYRREVILGLPLFEEGKEFHLEVVLKALAFGKRIIEIPATLEWKERRRHGRSAKRRSSSRIGRLVNTHLLFSVIVTPIRYLWFGSAMCGLAAIASMVHAFVRYLSDGPYANAILGFVGFSVLAVLLFSLGVISEQNRMVLKELWRIQADREVLPLMESGTDERFTDT